MYIDACDRSTPAQSLQAGAVALSRVRSMNPEIFVVGGNQLDHPTLNYCPTWTIANGKTRQTQNGSSFIEANGFVFYFAESVITNA